MSRHRPCGSSWEGFWCRRNRQYAWEEVAMVFADAVHANMFAAKLINTIEIWTWIAQLDVASFWAMHRASRYHWNGEKRAARKPIAEAFKHWREITNPVNGGMKG